MLSGRMKEDVIILFPYLKDYFFQKRIFQVRIPTVDNNYYCCNENISVLVAVNTVLLRNCKFKISCSAGVF